jgi:hypothetical protein
MTALARLPGQGSPRRRRSRLVLQDPGDVAATAARLTAGAVVAHGFANFYVITTRPDAEVVRGVNLLKGRPPGQVGSIVTTPARIPSVWDWSRLPRELARDDVLGLIDALFALGPFGFRGPAADDVPDHLTQDDAGVRTAQVIAPGYACPSNGFLVESLRQVGGRLLYVTSANRSRHRSGAADEPAHWRAHGLAADFGADSRFVLLEHADEAAALAGYPLHDPMSTSILALHRTAGHDAGGRRRLVLERHGSLPYEQLRRTVARHGFDVVLGPGAGSRLLQRAYA